MHIFLCSLLKYCKVLKEEVSHISGCLKKKEKKRKNAIMISLENYSIPIAENSHSLVLQLLST